MGRFATLRVPDQLMIIFAVIVVIVAIVGMIIYSSDSIKKHLRRGLTKLSASINDFNDRFFSDDEPFNSEWMDEDAWKKTRI